MRSDGHALQDLTQTFVLRQLGLIRTDQLPDLAARWLAADMTDSPSTRMLAGHNPSDPWTLDQLLAGAAAETGTTAPTDAAALQAIAIDWVTATWRDNHDTAWRSLHSACSSVKPVPSAACSASCKAVAASAARPARRGHWPASVRQTAAATGPAAAGGLGQRAAGVVQPARQVAVPHVTEDRTPIRRATLP